MRTILFFLLTLSGLSGYAQTKRISLLRQTGDNLVYTASINVTGWQTGSYYTLIPANTLSDGTSDGTSGVYLVTLRYNQSGLDVITQAYIVPIVISYPSAGVASLPGTGVNFSGTSRFFTPRYKVTSAGGQTVGLDVTPPENNLNSILTVTAYRLP